MSLAPRQPTVPIIGQQQQIQVHDIRVLIPSAVNFMKGGCDREGCVARVEVVDIAHGTVYMVPITLQGLRSVIGQLENLSSELDPIKQGEI